jgi:hypothetical protein
MLGETLGTVAALKEESPAGSGVCQFSFQSARLASKNQRWKSAQFTFDGFQRLGIRVNGTLLNR